VADTVVATYCCRRISSGLAVSTHCFKKPPLCVAAILILCLQFRVEIAAGQEQTPDSNTDPNTDSNFEIASFFKRPDQRAVELLEQGQFEQAAAEFDSPQWRGVSRFRGGQYKEAMEDFATATDATGLYNHGTAAVRAGDYTQAVSSFEKALELAPDNKDISHNLDIAKKLRDLADNQQQEQQSGDEQQEGEPSQENESSDENGQPQDSQQQDSKSQNGEEDSNDSPEGESQSDNSESDSSDSENSGEMSADAQDQTTDDRENQQQDAEALRDIMQQEQQENDAEQSQAPQSGTSTQNFEPDPVSEDEQATEQWLRRIPDDGSQLLRNKIRLNHLIEFPEVQDMQEPW